MEPLMIMENGSTPTVLLNKDKSKFEISGNSLPEDVAGFYAPVYDWIMEYVKQPNPTTEFHVKIVYFNSSSSKAILDILTMLEEIASKSSKVEVHWYYLEMDEDMLSTGKEFEYLLTIPFVFIPFQQDNVRLMEKNDF